MSVRTMLVLVFVIGLPLGWWSRKAHLQRASALRIDELNAAVIYDFEVLSEGRATPEAERRVMLARLGAGATVQILETPAARTRPPDPVNEWARTNIGLDYANHVVQVLAEHSNKIQDADLAALADFPRLEHLNLGETAIGDDGLAHLAGLTKLKVLHLDSTRVTDAGLVHLAGLTALERLSLGDNDGAITDLGLARLKGLKKLQVLEVGGPNITDDGLRALESLIALKEVWLLDVPNVTPEGLKRLNQALPNLKIAHTRKPSRRGSKRVAPRF